MVREGEGDNPLLDSEISHTEIVSAIRSLKNGKAPGIEGVPGEF